MDGWMAHSEDKIEKHRLTPGSLYLYPVFSIHVMSPFFFFFFFYLQTVPCLCDEPKHKWNLSIFKFFKISVRAIHLRAPIHTFSSCLMELYYHAPLSQICMNLQLANHYGQSVSLSVKQRPAWFVYLSTKTNSSLFGYVIERQGD